jgi:phage-related protein (TIGR01555 family)
MKFKRKSALNIDPNDEKSSVVGNAVAATMKTDAFSNPGARTGFGEMNLINTTEYPLTRLSQNWSLLTSLYRSSWIVQRVCSIIPEDAMTDLRIEAPGLDNDSLDKLDECISKTKIRRQIIEAIKWARLYGGAAAVIMIDGQDEDLLKPLRVNDILPGSFRGLFIVDRWSGIYPSLELVSNPASPDYGLPRFYEVRDEDGVLKYRIHHSRILRFIGTQMPYYESLAEQQWGTSAVEAMYDDLVRRDNVTHNIANLTFKACLSVYEIDSLDQIFASASASAQRRMYSMIEAMSILESNLGVRLVNKGDAVQQLQYSFGGLPEVLDGAMLDVSGSTAIPATRLFGRSPAGMNSTGESDEKNYRSTLEQQRSIHIYPALEKLAPIVSMSALGGVPAGLEFKLPPLDEMTPTEKADLIERSSQYLERLFQAGVIPADTLLNGVRNSQLDVGITSTITDDNIESVKGKYIKDISPQADPFGGMFQGGESEEGNETENPDMINPINKVPEKSIQSQPEVPEKSPESTLKVTQKSA